MNDYFPDNANHEYKKHIQFQQCLWTAFESLESTPAIFSNVTENEEIYAYPLYGIGDVDYLFISTPLKCFIVASNKSSKFKNELALLQSGYHSSVYFDYSVASFIGKTTKGGDSIPYLMEINEYSRIIKYQKSNLKADLYIFRGEFINLSHDLNIVSDFIKSLQHHKLFPNGNIDKELLKIGQAVAIKNQKNDLAFHLTSILHSLQQNKNTIKKAISHNDGSGKIYLANIPNTFIIEEKKGRGLVSHYDYHLNTWNVFSYYYIGTYQNSKSILNLIKNNTVNVIRDVSIQFQDDKLVYVGTELTNVHLDMASAYYELEDHVTLKTNKNL